MKKRQNTRGYKRYFALDNHREYILVGAQNEAQEWVVVPRRVGIEKFPEWAKLNFREGDIVILETTTNVWATYDIVAPLVSWVLVANAADVGEIAGARVKTDKEDIKRLLTLLFGGIVPEVWVPPVHVRELRAFISYRNRLVATGTMVRNRLQSWRSCRFVRNCRCSTRLKRAKPRWTKSSKSKAPASCGANKRCG
jgi:transposase